MGTLVNPAEQLAPLVSRLYDLAGNSKVTAEDRKQLLVLAHDLRGDLVNIVSMQFSESTDAYLQVMKDLGAVTASVNQAEQDIRHVITVVDGAAKVAKSIDDLLQEAIKIGAAVR